jgi:RNase P subunit RPR2
MSQQFEIRFCDNCMTRTKQYILDYENLRNMRGYASFKCDKCGKVKRMRLLRPSAESSY